VHNKCIINLAGWLNETTFYKITERNQIIEFLNTKVDYDMES
jgi:hypothetical protein